MAIAGWTATVFGILIFRAEIGHWDGRSTAAAVILFLFGGPIALLSTILMIWGKTFLDVDPAAGTARFVNLGKVAWQVPLRELSDLSILEKDMSGLRNRRFVWFELRVAGREETLFTSSNRERVEERCALLERLVASSAIRSILAMTMIGDGALRDAPDVVMQAKQAVRDPARLAQVLIGLSLDDDPEIRTRAIELQKAIERA